VKRRLWIEIDADAETCGSCQKLNDELRGRPSCDVFDTCLQLSDRKNPDSSPLRCTGCLAAEDAAKPRQASEDDDDPAPHHLGETRCESCPSTDDVRACTVFDPASERIAVRLCAKCRRVASGNEEQRTI
jgi:hypothetical protein